MNIDDNFLDRVKRDVIYKRDIAAPSVNAQECNGCGKCVRACSVHVFELIEKKAAVSNGKRCFACGHCLAVCPQNAITHKDALVAPHVKPGEAPAISPDMLQQFIREKRSTRLFTDKPVSKQQILQIIEAGRYTPSATNTQNVKYIVLSDRDKVTQLRNIVESLLGKIFKAARIKPLGPLLNLMMGNYGLDIMRYYGEAYRNTQNNKNKRAYFPLPYGSAAILVHSETSDVMGPFNCASALSNCSLMAHSMGLGSCFLGFVQLSVNEDKSIKRWLNIPKENQCNGAMVIGYPDVTYHRLVERKKPDIQWL